MSIPRRPRRLHRDRHRREDAVDNLMLLAGQLLQARKREEHGDGRVSASAHSREF
jgi:hypothetical protein